MPNVPAVPGIARSDAGTTDLRDGPTGAATESLQERAASFFAVDGTLAASLPDFEPRPSQLAMAAAVARVFEHGGVLLAEAGTGTGKTLAYLVPAILSAQRVLVSTGTKNLQEQIFFKDIPALRHAIGIDFSATYMKGRANYLCLRRLEQVKDSGAASTPAGAMFLPIVEAWAKTTGTGDRAELEDLPEDVPFWSEIAATAETCVGAECPRYNECFVTRMRQRAAESDVVIVNHHLLCADAAVRQNAYGEVIPSCSRAIVDEAHQLEDVATQYFGFSVSNYRVEELARDVERTAAVRFAGDGKNQDEIARAVEKLRDRARAFFSDLTFAHRSAGAERLRATPETLADAADAAAQLVGALDLVEATLATIVAGPERSGAWSAGPERSGSTAGVEPGLSGPAKTKGGLSGPAKGKGGLSGSADQERGPADEEQTEVLLALARRAREVRDELRFLLRASDSDYVYYVEFRGRGVFLRASPIDVSRIVRELLLDRMQTTVLTSATLTVDGTFEYIRGRLGVAHADELRLPSEFDYRDQAILYLPSRMPDPRAADFAAAAGREVIEILKRTEGRAFVLFTSYAMLRAVQAIAEMALDYPILVQGTAPRSQLLRQFRETPHSVLLATSSFWQGVDVIGEALSCVIIDKLPFASPGDPITAARIDAIRAQGGEPFGDYQVPLAILTLQQGLGRLIRHRRDRGVLAVLDPRLRTKGYGRRFLASLPGAPVVHDLEKISRFFDRV